VNPTDILYLCVQSSSRRVAGLPAAAGLKKTVSGLFQVIPRQAVSALLALTLVLALPILADAQTSAVRSLITQDIDETKLTTLHGNTHPLARAEFDRGAAPASLAMDHMLLLLKRSSEQEAALETLLAQQQYKTSPNYHNWLTPEQFGQKFGPANADVQAVTNWLQSHGFQNVNVSNGRTTIDFSGTAGQVQAAFHTTIHKYVLANGEEHWANPNDPQIPTALDVVVAGVNSLNNFPRKPLHHTGGAVRRSTATGKFTRVSPEFTYSPTGGCFGVTNTNCYGIGPGDFATIYNVPSTIGGAVAGLGQTIAIVSDSDVYPSDVNQFRSLFGLPAYPANSTGYTPCPANTPCFQMIETGTSPGVIFDSGNGDEVEAIIDVEWSGATAPGATIDLVVSPSTNNTFGGDTSAVYVINGSISPLPQILSSSYGDCELFLGTSGNLFYKTEWQQAAGEGITVLVATGDTGSAGCDSNNPSGPTVQPATYGLAVDGVASTPYNVAVGGTDFNDFNNPTTYFKNVPGTISSAIGYIPETAYNDTCANPIIYGFFGLSAEAACNNANVQSYYLVEVGGGGGGVSNCTTPNGPGPSNCSGGYAKPSWQVGTGVPADGLRDVPDVSLFAGDGTIQNFYVVCESDLVGLNAGLTPAPCSLASPYQDFVGEGGTSVAAQAFAGIVALIDQKQGGRQGNINTFLYSLAGGSSASSIFHDITSGTNAMPCIVETGVTGCVINTTGDTVGVLSGYSAGIGYDQATGLGSVNVANLINNSGPAPLTVTTTTASLPTGLKGQAYPSTQLMASGGVPPYTWTLASGSLPTGLTGLSATPGAGVITGTPTASGAFPFTVQVKDSVGTTVTSGTLTITINSSLSITPASGTATITVSTPGQTSTTQLITVTGANGFAGTVTLSAANTASPTGAVDAPTCSFGAPDSNFTAPGTITLSAASETGTATLSCTTTAASQIVLRPSSRPSGRAWPLAGVAISLVCLFFLLAVPKQRRWKMVPLAVLFVVVAAAGVSCGGGSSSGGGGGVTNPGTTLGNYTVTVTATPSTGTAQVITITVNVQ
jgi:hypothetical protein